MDMFILYSHFAYKRLIYSRTLNIFLYATRAQRVYYDAHKYRTVRKDLLTHIMEGAEKMSQRPRKEAQARKDAE